MSTQKSPLGWEYTLIKDIAELHRGVSYKKIDASKTEKKGYLPVLRANNINDEINFNDLVYVPEKNIKSEQLIREGDIIIAMSSGSKHLVGKAAQAKNDFKAGFGVFCGLIRPSDVIDKKYIGYFFYSSNYRQIIRKFSSGININNLRRTHIEELAISVPPLTEQRRIVTKIEELFTRLDAGIKSLKNAQAQLKRYRQSVLKAAVEGRLTAEWRERRLTASPCSAQAGEYEFEPADKLLERILKERHEKWEAELLAKYKSKGKKPPKNWQDKYKEPTPPDTTNLPELPNSWEWSFIDQISYEIRYGSSSRTNTDKIGIPILRMGNIIDGNLVFNKLKYLPENHYEFPDLFLISGDLLFNRTNSPELVGKTAIYEGFHSPCSFASYLIRVRFCEGIEPHFISFFINSSYGRAWIRSVVSQQVGQANVNGTKLKNLTVPLPPLYEQIIITKEIDRIFSICREIEAPLESEIKRAQSLRQSILKRAFEGKLVPQDPNDLSASVLLERIKAEKAKNKKAKQTEI